MIFYYNKGPSIKDVRSQGGFVQCGHFADKGEGGSSDADVCIFYSDFSKFMVYPYHWRSQKFWLVGAQNEKKLWCYFVDVFRWRYGDDAN